MYIYARTHTCIFSLLYNESLLPAFVLYIVCIEKSTLGQASILGGLSTPTRSDLLSQLLPGLLLLFKRHFLLD